MSVWYDPHVGRDRSTLPYKIVFVWGWTALRWVMFRCMSSDRAHEVGIKGLRWFGRIDRAWRWASLPFHLVWLFFVVLPSAYLYRAFLVRTGLLMVGPFYSEMPR